MKRKWFWRTFGLLLVVAAVIDGIRYLQPGRQTKLNVHLSKPSVAAAVKELIFVYNANGGIYPGLADFIHKEVFPSSYPCNLCYHTFGTFIMKEEWKAYLETLPYQKSFLHKDQYKRTYKPEDLQQPVVLASDGKETWLLVSAAELNKARSTNDIINLLNQKLTP